MKIESQRPEHLPEVLAVNQAAFGRHQEARLVESLVQNEKAAVSLVAVESGKVVGHALFSAVKIWPDKKGVRAAGLGPVAVLKEHRGKGIASQLIEAGLKECREQGFGAVFVLGEVDFYSRFGFASMYVIECEYEAPEGGFMALELKPAALAGVQGKALYEPEFGLTV